jgi:hypothetical protein
MIKQRGRLTQPIPQRRLLLAAALLNGVLAAGTFWVGMGFYDARELREWPWCLCAVPGAVLLYYWFGKHLCRQHDKTRRQLLWRGVGLGSLVAFGNVPLTLILRGSMDILITDVSPVDILGMVILGTAVGSITFAPVAIFCGFCLGLANSLVVWHGHVAPKQREILRLQGEYPEVPEGAISRWQPTAEQPTDRSLSRVPESDQSG